MFHLTTPLTCRNLVQSVIHMQSFHSTFVVVSDILSDKKSIIAHTVLPLVVVWPGYV